MQLRQGITQNLLQQQKLLLTQQMQLSIQILQMSSQELCYLIEQEYEKNPMLELEYAKEDYHKESYTKQVDPIFYEKRSKTQLKDDLKQQLAGYRLKPKLKQLVLYLIESLDTHGYVTSTTEEVSQLYRCNIEDAQEALAILQSFTPIGIGSRNIQECLKLQLQKQNKLDDKMLLLIDQYLIELGKGNLQQLSKKLGISLAILKTYKEWISALEPNPARGYDTGEIEQYIIPDVIVEQVGENLFIQLNESFMPKLMISSQYEQAIEQVTDKKIKEYLKQNKMRVQMLLQGINGRKETLLKVCTEIVTIQEEYLKGKTNQIKSITLNKVAQKLEMHESTISRTIKNKYIQTPIGIKPIKDLFAKGVQTGEGEEIATDFIKKRIGHFINEENRKKPMSDEQIATLLAEEGIKVARRTVAKYRDVLGIPSSTTRKKQYKQK